MGWNELFSPVVLVSSNGSVTVSISHRFYLSSVFGSYPWEITEVSFTNATAIPETSTYAGLAALVAANRRRKWRSHDNS
jgi:hypothetical protein